VPKELHEISQFITGTITSPSERDIPDDAASYSLNIDPTTQDGVLQGVPEDENIEYVSNSETGATSDLAVNATSMAIINDSGSRDFETIKNAIDMKRFFNPRVSHLEYVTDKNLIVSPADPHPSTEGHVQWANKLKEFIDANNLRTI